MFSLVGYEYHLDSALVKPTQERWLKLKDLILRLKSKHVLTARCLMLLIGFPCLNGENGPGGMPSHEALSVSPQGALEISSVTGQPPSLDTISAHLEWWQNPSNVMKGADLHPKDHSIHLFTDASNKGWGAHLVQASTKGLWSDREKGYI